MEPYNITTDQLQEYRQSVHWKMMSVEGDLSAPTCNDCHGNHGATPPGISWVGNVCGQCHVVQAGLFNKSVLAKVFVEIGTPGCATCHNNHEIMGTGDEMLGVGEGAVCADCHAPDDKGGMAAAAMREQIDGLRGEYDKAHAIVSQAEFELQGAKDALVKARAAIHAFTVEAVKKETDTGLTIAAKAYTLGVQALEEVQFRRKGLAVSVVIILALIGGLVVKIQPQDLHQLVPRHQCGGFSGGGALPGGPVPDPPTRGRVHGGVGDGSHQSSRRKAEFGAHLQVRQPPGDPDPDAGR
jgi:predicted CXXCH cytochrome family protein